MESKTQENSNSGSIIGADEPKHIPFPYEYTPVHPQLHQYKKQSFIHRFISKPIYSVLKPLVLVFRVSMILLFLFIQAILLTMIDFGTDKEKPQTVFRRKLFRLTTKICCSIILLAQGFVVKVVRKPAKNSKSAISVMNHRSGYDILVNGIIGVDGMIGKEAYTSNFLTGAPFKASRSIQIGKKNQSGFQILKERFTSGQNWPPITVYAEGTVTSFGVILRLRTGCFRLGLPIQPVALKFFYEEPFEWLFETVPEHFLATGNNLTGRIEASFLDVMSQQAGEWPRQFADRVGKAMADEIGSVYVPYQSEDVYYFNGKGDISKCTEEYLRDYGWMGTLKDYKEMCKKAGLNWRYEWPKERFVNIE
ncbi:Lysophospholipid_acyltransferase [Hexamita inflata]|uniref:Lysophospholipid_acyltransferase n=1 Tax=Hexamita inflata TaxID=28002 RepID=A0ABP1HJH5_9EUKA